MNDGEITALIATGIVCLPALIIPVVSMLIKHQQSMARILRDNNDHASVEDQLDLMRNEILQLTMTVGAIKSSLPLKENHGNDAELTARLGGGRG